MFFYHLCDYVIANWLILFSDRIYILVLYYFEKRTLDEGARLHPRVTPGSINGLETQWQVERQELKVEARVLIERTFLIIFTNVL